MILYLVGNFDNFNSGHGGHQYSALQTAKSIEKFCPVIICSIGQSVPAAFKNSKNTIHIFSNRPSKSVANILLNILSEEIKRKKLKIVHIFDYNVLFTALEVCKRTGSKLVFTKCGGPPMRLVAPIFPNMIVYHDSDFKIITKRIANKNLNIEKIPGRVRDLKYNCDRAENLFGKKTKTTFFRIGRINRSYQPVIESSINLLSMLHLEGMDVCLHIIGFVEDQEVFRDVYEKAKALPFDIYFHTDQKTTNNAAELIGYCDCVIGTGRGLIESLSQGKISFFPVRDKKIPCLFSEETWKFGAYENFSTRTIIPKECEEFFKIDNIKNAVENPEINMKLCSFSRQIFDQEYNLDVASLKIVDFYRKIEISSDLRSTRALLGSCKTYWVLLRGVECFRSLKARARTFYRE